MHAYMCERVLMCVCVYIYTPHTHVFNIHVYYIYVTRLARKAVNIGKRDLLLKCQKRPFSVKRGMFQCQKRPITSLARQAVDIGRSSQEYSM
jgi:hypothetical protein